jgi:hypothetical protein
MRLHTDILAAGVSHGAPRVLGAVRRSAVFILPDPAPPLGLKSKVKALLFDEAGALELQPRTSIERYTDGTEANSHGSPS